MTLKKSDLLIVKKGYCYLADMNPPRLSKPGKVRPVVVIQSQDTLDVGSPGVVVVPVTSQLQESNVLRVRLSPSPSLRLDKASDLLLDQIHTIDRRLLIEELGAVPADQLASIENGVKFLFTI